ncbi:MAG: nitrite reductase, copper-containing [Candidatus Moranbacteria bacterium]|nr:nitrite reductase, copper-containing [Candidatus Moranbacteria bacterium]
MKTFGPSMTHPGLPFKNIISFFRHLDGFERVENIARNPNEVPAPISRDHEETVDVFLETKEVIAEIAPGIFYNYWTFDGKVPGPFLRVREGDKVRVHIKNNDTSLHPHNVDFHAVTGPGGGATVSTVMPGETKEFSFKALQPGLYIYHCAIPNVAVHMTHGMYGLILVEPKEGLPKVDKELYVVQGEFYSTGALGKEGLQVFDGEAMLDGHPQYIVFNGKTGALVDTMEAKVGERVRVFFGNGGVNLISSFHVIGEIFDRVYSEGGIGGDVHHNVQTTLVPAGGATMVEFTLEVPGKYMFVDHALARLDRGLWGVLSVSGEENKEIFDGVMDTRPITGH